MHEGLELFVGANFVPQANITEAAIENLMLAATKFEGVVVGIWLKVFWCRMD